MLFPETQQTEAMRTAVNRINAANTPDRIMLPELTEDERWALVGAILGRSQKMTSKGRRAHHRRPPPIADDPAAWFAQTVLYRVFNNGSFDLGGRFYGPSWQALPKAWRGRIQIDGEAVVELDYGSLHPRQRRRSRRPPYARGCAARGRSRRKGRVESRRRDSCGAWHADQLGLMLPLSHPPPSWMRRYSISATEAAMPDDEVRFDASTPDTAAVSLAELVAEISRLAASISSQRANIRAGESWEGIPPDLAAELPKYRQRLDDTEARLTQVKGELAKGFAWIAKGAYQ
jgi:hypothetical protein